MRHNWGWRLLTFFVLISSLYRGSADPLDNWTRRYSSGHTYSDFAFANGTFIAIGSSRILTSTNGIIWKQLTTPFSLPFFRHGKLLAYGNGIYVVLSSDGFYTSVDLAEWTFHQFPDFADLYSIIFGEGLFVAAGAKGVIMTSSNGIDWTAVNSNYLTDLNYIYYGGGHFLAYPYDYGGLISSTNGVDWHYVSVVGPTLSEAAFGNGVFLLGDFDGFQIYHDDAWDYYGGSGMEFLTQITYGNGTFFTISRSAIYSSTNGTAWTKRSFNEVVSNPSLITFGNGTFVVMTADGRIYQSEPIPNSHPQIETNPEATTVREGDQARLAPLISGSDPKTYQWLKDNAPVEGATNLLLKIPKAQLSDAGLYTLMVRNSEGTATTQPTAINVEPQSVRLNQWHLRHGMLTNQTFSKLAYGNGSYIAVEQAGTALASSNAFQWIRTKISPDHLCNIRFINGRFVALSDAGTVAISSNATLWTISKTPSRAPLYDIAFGKNLYAAVGDGGRIFTTQDLTTWTEHPSGQTNALKGITFGDGMFVAVGDNGAISVSNDGQKWKPSASGTKRNLLVVDYGDGKFLAGGEGKTLVYASKDLVGGLLWQRSQLSGNASNGTHPIRYVVFWNGTFYVGGNEDEGVVHFKSDDPTAYFRQFGVAIATRADNSLIGLGVHGKTFSPTADYWTYAAPTNAFHLKGITARDNLVVTVGSSGSILISTNAFTWTSVSSGITNHLNCIAASDSLFVAAGNEGTVVTSTDGMNWTKQSVGVSTYLTMATYGNGTFVISSQDGTIFSSTNGQNWTQCAAINGILGLAFGNDLFLAPYRLGLLISTNGNDWQKSIPWPDLIPEYASFPVATLGGIAFADGTFFLSVDGGTFLTSTNGYDWQKKDVRPRQPLLRPLVAGQQHYLTFGPVGEIYSSDNGTTWLPRNLGTSWPMANGLYFNGTFLAIGDYGTIIQSDPLSDAPPEISLQLEKLREAREGEKVQLAVGVIGTSPITYQWSYNGQPILGATNATLELDQVLHDKAGAYDVLVSNKFGSIRSIPTILSVEHGESHLPQLTIQPASSGQFELLFTGKPGEAYRLESADDLSDRSIWEPLSIFYSDPNSVHWPISQAASTRRFYRVVHLY